MQNFMRADQFVPGGGGATMRGRNLQKLNIIRHTSLNVFCTEAGALQRNKVLKKPLLRNTGAL